MAETTFAVTQVPPGRGLEATAFDAALWRSSGVAKPALGDGEAIVLVGSGEVIEGTEIEVIDPEGGVCDGGRAGEIRVRSDSLMGGYFADQETSATVIRDGWYHTGDIGFLHGRELYVTGRKKDLVIVAGHNVYPHDVEETVGAVPGIKPGRVVAFGVHDEALGTERLVLLAETDGEPATEHAELAESVRAHVSSIFGVTPYDVRIVPERTLRKSTSGKLSRVQNRTMYLEELVGPA
jgi:acyl-CoA synthetase (AMP-forming)/AMP-acid ligase II